MEAGEIPYAPFRSVSNDAPAMRRTLATLSLKLRQAQESRLREFRRRQQKLQGLTDLQRAFLSVITHELTTPVSNALMSQEVLSKFVARDGWPEMAQGSLADLQQHIRLAQRQIGAVVGYANLIAGQVDLFLQPVNLAIICRRAVVQSPRPIEVDIGNDLPVVQGDRLRLAEAMGYLMDNACKFSPSESTVRAKLWVEGSTVRFEVIDQV